MVAIKPDARPLVAANRGSGTQLLKPCVSDEWYTSFRGRIAARLIRKVARLRGRLWQGS